MTTEKRIELAAMFLARCINEPLDIRASGDTRKKLCMYALAWADALAEIAGQDKPKTRYDWSKVPDWAMWVATDNGGGVWAFEEKPFICESLGGFWNCNLGPRASRLMTSGVCPDWRGSLEARPDD